MAASANNIAATFATISKSTSAHTSSSSPSHTFHQTPVAHPVLHKSLSMNWNPHMAFPLSHKSSLLNLYGPPGPPPPVFRSTPVRRGLQISERRHPDTFLVGQKLPNIALSYLDKANKLRSASLSSLGRGKRLVIVKVSAAFSPDCRRFIERVRAKSLGSVVCVAANDVHVMKAWGENLGAGDKMVMFSDESEELSGVLGVRWKRFCLSSINGSITSVDFESDDDEGGIQNL